MMDDLHIGSLKLLILSWLRIFVHLYANFWESENKWQKIVNLQKIKKNLKENFQCKNQILKMKKIK